MDELVQRAKCGSQDAFVALIERQKQSLWRTAMAVLHHPDDASDALQETVLEAWKNLPKLKDEAYFNTWLTRILLYNSYDILRKRHKESPAENIWDNSTFMEQDETMDVRRALDCLAQNDRLVLTLFYLNDLPVKEIARILEVREGAVRVRLARARERFKEKYESQNKSRKEKDA